LSPSVRMETFPAATVPGTQHDVDFMVKDSKRFADSGGWGYAVFDMTPHPKVHARHLGRQAASTQMSNEQATSNSMSSSIRWHEDHGCLILRHGQTGDHNIRVVREAQTIRPVG
jgi:hypothetical protein